ncbi:MAG: hypothetical protein MPK62_11630 [Alphaproteobacteria bacterium]|nr:hypothetical protein [Alphaproteobacteria bacterium]
MKFAKVAILGGAILLSGCATIFTPSTSSIDIGLYNAESAECTFRNPKGRWKEKVPGTVRVPKAADPVRYECTTAEGKTEEGFISNEFQPISVLNLFNFLGWAVDIISGKWSKYPAFHEVDL